MENIAIPVLAQSVVKIMILIGLSLYTIFAAIIVRQEQLMDKVIDETFETVLRVLVVLHLIFAIGILILAFVLL